MKIQACSPDGGAFKYILDGLGNSFRAAGHEFRNVQKVTNDFDLYLGCSGWRQDIPRKSDRRGKVGIHVNPYGPRKVGSVDGGPVIDEPKKAIEWTLQQKPDFVYCYCSDTFIPEYYGYYTSRHGIPVVSMSTAADITVYKPQPKNPEFACDIGWVGGYWPYKAHMLDPYLVPLLKLHKCKIYGWGGWQKFIGRNFSIDDNKVASLFSTAKICPSISEPHTRVFPVDVPERVFKVPAAGGFTIHTPSPAVSDLFGDVIPMAKNPTEWYKLIRHYLANNDEREYMAGRQRSLILRKHTYFDRACGIADVIGRPGLRTALEDAKEKLI